MAKKQCKLFAIILRPLSRGLAYMTMLLPLPFYILLLQHRFSATVKPKAVKGKASVNKGSKGDTAEVIRSYLFGMRKAGVNQAAETEVLLKTGYARTDSTGYRNTMKELTKTLRHVTKSNGMLSLTEAGLAFVEKHGDRLNISPASMQEHQEMLKQTILDNAKAPEKAVSAIWNLLLDGRAHPVADVLKAAGYQRADSTGYREVMKWLKKFDLVQKEGKTLCFTDKVYRYGFRPMDL